MKHLIYISFLSFFILACEKDPPENISKPPVINYPFDSIHKKLLGNWVIRFPNGSGGFDTSRFYKITYDSFIFKFNTLYCSWCDTLYRAEIINYKYFKDSIEGKFPGTDSTGNLDYFYWKTRIDIFTKDSIKIYKLHENNIFQRFDVTLVR